MSKITKKQLEDYAGRLMFQMNEDEYDTLSQEFDIILKQMDLISNIKGIEQVTPMTFPFEIKGKELRPDEVRDAITIDEALSNVKEKVGNEIKVPKVVE